MALPLTARPPAHYYANPTPGTALRLTVTNNLGCTSTGVGYPFGLASTIQRRTQAALTLYPNPASGGAVSLTLPGLRPQAPVAGQLLDGLGRVVRELRLPVAELQRGTAVEVSSLPAGVYALHLHPLEGPITARLGRQ